MLSAHSSRSVCRIRNEIKQKLSKQLESRICANSSFKTQHSNAHSNKANGTLCMSAQGIAQ